MRLLYKTGPMESLRKWFYKPKRDDRSLLAQFFFADDALNMVAAELDSFDGRKDPERCSTLVNQLRHAQDRVLNITSQIMDQLLGDERVARGFRVKFPEDVLQDNLAGQLWFGAECLAAGSSIMNREEESAAMRPLAKALTRSLETVRSLLREQCLRPRGAALSCQDDMLHESLRIFDRLFAEFELCYVSAMVNVKTPHEFEAQQLICVLFSESLRRALRQRLLTQEQVDAYDPALMFAVPRLAIVSGLLIYSSGPLSIDKPPEEMSDMFRPFRTLLHKIRSLLWTLDRRELTALERLLCTNEDVANLKALDLPAVTESSNESCEYPDIGEFVSRYYTDGHPDFYTQASSSEPVFAESDYLPDNLEVMTPIIDGLRRLEEDVDTEHESETEKTDARPDRPDRPDTFQEERRKTSRAESTDLSSLRNLSSNGLNMFDPIVINAASTSERQLPDNDLVTSLDEQVTEIADRLSSIANDVDIVEHTNQTHSFSTNDMPALMTDEAYGYGGPRNEQLSCMPSTSHGYLIPNAISHEPVVLSLSHNNSAVFNPEDEENRPNNELPLMIPDIDNEIAQTNITIANVNLSSLLLTNEEFRNSFIERENETEDNTSFHSAKMTIEKSEEDRVKFMLGFESDHESPGDSGVSTENASLDRSPDTEANGYIQNRVLKEDKDIESSNNDVNVNIKYTEQEEVKNEAGTSIDNNVNINILTTEEYNEATNSRNDWGANDPVLECRNIDEVIKVLRKQRNGNKKINTLLDEEEPTSSKKKVKNPKSKRKKKMWSPGIVILDNRSTQAQASPLRLNLDHFVDESSCGRASEAHDWAVARALQARELRARDHARGKFKSSEDLIHRLFVCIAGVADQLQTNFAADLRNILKSVFLMNQTPDPEPEPEPDQSDDKSPTIEYEATEGQVMQNGSSFDSVYSAEEAYADSRSDSTQSEGSNHVIRRNTVNSGLGDQAAGDRRKSVDNAVNMQASVSTGDLTFRVLAGAGGALCERAPEWVPDIAAPACMRCAAHFTAFRRRHHCRNCGKVFCASCSSNSIPLPRYGQMKPVRVCEECFQAIARSHRHAHR